MLKKAPSRNQRTKGIRVKHILQIALLLGVCFWLVYQLKHSHDKKAALDDKDVKTAIRTVSEGELLKLGRKDFPYKEVTKNVKEDDEEEEAIREEEEKLEVQESEYEDRKHEAEEREGEDPKNKAEGQEDEENKNEDTEDEGRGAGDDEIDETEQERKDGEAHEEDLVDEDKESEDEMNGGRNEGEEREDQAGKENSTDDQDNDGGDRNSHEAREEHYKGDDASSAVTHDTQVISSESEKVSSEGSNENSETSSLGKEINSNYTEDGNGNQTNSKLVDGRTTGSGTLSMSTIVEKLNESSSNPAESSLSNAIGKIQSNDISEAENNSTRVSTETSNNPTKVDQETDLYQPKGRETVSESDKSQNATLDTTEGITGQNLVVEQNNNTVSANRSDSSSAVSSDTVETTVLGNIPRSGTAEPEHSRSSPTKESTDATKNEESHDTSESRMVDSKNVTENAVQHDPIDSFDSRVSKDEKEARTGFPLPDMKTEGSENGEAAAEQ